MNRIFENGAAKGTCVLLHLGDKKVVNVQMLIFNEKDGQMKELDPVLNNIIAWAKGRKAKEVWIPSDRKTPADEKLEKLGFKEGAVTVQLPGNSPSGWKLIL